MLMKESSLLRAERMSYIVQQFWVHHMLMPKKKSLCIPDDFLQASLQCQQHGSRQPDMKQWLQ
jgi:hypothetical protein